jgi:hypothetical protein
MNDAITNPYIVLKPQGGHFHFVTNGIEKY